MCGGDPDGSADSTTDEGEFLRKATRLHEVAVDLETADDRGTVFEIAVDAAGGILAFDTCAIVTAEEDVLVTEAVSSDLSEAVHEELPIEGSLAGRAYRTGESLSVPDLDDHDEALPANPAYTSSLSAPIGTRGVLQAASTRRAAFTEQDRRMAEILATHVNQALERIETTTRLDERSRKIERLHQVAVEVMAADEEQAVYDLAMDAAEDILAFDMGVIGIERDGYFRVVATTDEIPEDGYRERPLEEAGLAARSIRDGESFHLDDAQAHEGTAPVKEYRAALSVPLGTFGVLQTATFEPGTYSQSDHELAELLASHVTEAVERIRSRRALEAKTAQLQRQNERLDEFASFVSHDLRNPLGIAQTYLDFARETGDDEDFDAVEESLERMDGMIDGLLALARLDADALDQERLSLSAVARRAWETVETGDATIEVTRDIELTADRESLRHVLENLFRNSVEHGVPDDQSATDAAGRSVPAGGSLTVTVGRLADGGFYVADDGRGIPEDDRAAILDHGYSETDTGTGLGMSIVQRIVEIHGWSLHVTESGAGGARIEIVTDGADS